MTHKLYDPWKNHDGKQSWAMLTFTGLSWFNTKADADRAANKALDWVQMTPENRLAFCKDRFPAYGVWGLRTALPWAELSPSSQLLLKNEGIPNQAIYERNVVYTK